MRTLTTAMALTAAALCFSGAAAQNEVISNPNQIVPNVALSQVTPLLDEAGYEYQLNQTEEETVLYVTVNGTNMMLMPRVCQSETDCDGLWMLALIDGAIDQNIINEFNNNSPATRAAVRGNQVWLDRYLIADYGITRGSLVINIEVFASTIQDFLSYGSEPAE